MGKHPRINRRASSVKVLMVLAFLAPSPTWGQAGLESARPAVGSSKPTHPHQLHKAHRPAPAYFDRDCEGFYDALVDAEISAISELVRNADIYCISDLEWGHAAAQVAIAKEAVVIAVAEAVPVLMQSYDGTSSDVKKLFNFLRMVADIRYWCLVRESCTGAVWAAATNSPWRIDPGSPVHEAIARAVDSFVSHPRYADDTYLHADNLWELVNVIIDYKHNGRYLDQVAWWLNHWTPRYADQQIFRDVLYQWLSVLYEGHRDRDLFGPQYGENRELMIALRDFVLNKERLNTPSQRFMELSVLELARYANYPDTANYVAVGSVIEEVFDAYADDASGPIALRLVAELGYGDPEGGNCHLYGTCQWYDGDGFAANFRNALFPNKLACPHQFGPDDSVTLHAQALAGPKLETACTRLSRHASTFHELFETNFVPVGEDFNDHLDIFVFSDGASCEDMESAAFFRNADTCSGVYYEGDPADGNTRAQAVVTEYEPWENPSDPELPIWNFEHEYGHYLDGRYNRHGGYNGALDSIHWWTEGFAEYFAAEVSPYISPPRRGSPHSLQDILLHSDSLGAGYRDRHLAVRFFMENHRHFIDAIVDYMRAGLYGDYTEFLREEAPKYQDGWRSWLQADDSPPSPTPESEPEREPGAGSCLELSILIGEICREPDSVACIVAQVLRQLLNCDAG